MFTRYIIKGCPLCDLGRRYASISRSLKGPNFVPKDAVVQNLNDGQHSFIIRPPPSAASDPTERNVIRIPTNVLPPPVRENKKIYAKMTDDQIAEIQRLRMEDPIKNSGAVLSKKFGCSRYFISMVAPLPKDIARKKKEDFTMSQKKLSRR